MKIWKRDHYERQMVKRAETVQDYQLQIQHAQEKIAELQAKCKHDSFTVMFWSYRPGAMHPARVCDKCNALVPGITEQESNELFSKQILQNGLITNAGTDILKK